MSHLDTGDLGEDLAAKTYKKQGYKLLASNVRIHGYKQLGEIDLILIRKKELVFAEVKTRSTTTFMPIEETITYQKKKRLLKAIKAYLQKNPKFNNYNKRIDAVFVTPGVDKSTQSVKIIIDAIQDDLNPFL